MCVCVGGCALCCALVAPNKTLSFWLDFRSWPLERGRVGGCTTYGFMYGIVCQVRLRYAIERGFYLL